MDVLGNVPDDVGAAHSLLNLCLGVLAVAALTAVRLAQNTHLKALAVLLLAVWFLAFAPIDVARRRRFTTPCILLIGGMLTMAGWTLSLLCFRVLAIGLDSIRATGLHVLHFGLKGEGIPLSNISSWGTYLISMLFGVAAVATLALIVAESTCSEALTVHFEALRFWALADQILNSATSLFEKCQLRIQSHRLLSLYGLFAWTSSFTFSWGGWWGLQLVLASSRTSTFIWYLKYWVLWVLPMYSELYCSFDLRLLFFLHF